MINGNEIVMLLLGVGIMCFIIVNQLKFNGFQEWKILEAGFFVLLLGWTMTVLEGIFLNELMNYIEHICYAASSILVAVWFWKVFGKENESK